MSQSKQLELRHALLKFSGIPMLSRCKYRNRNKMVTQAQLSDVDAGSLTIESSLFMVIRHSLDKSPHSLLAIVTHQCRDHLKMLRAADKIESSRNEDCLTWTYSDMQSASLKLVAGLTEHGINPGATIATFLPNSIEPLLFNWTSILGKYTYAPLDPGATSSLRSAEVRTMLETVVPDVVVVSDATAAANLDSVFTSQITKPILKIVLDMTIKPPSGWTDLVTVASKVVDVEVERRITTEALTDDLERVALILFTSGTTTGKPKGCPLTVRNRLFLTSGQDLRAGDGESRYGYITQNFRAIAAVLSTISWSKGHCLVLPGPGFSPPELLEAIEKHKVNWFAFVPFALHAVIAHPQFPNTDVSGVRSIALGADMITKDLYRKASYAFPNADVWAAHGMTEGGAAFDWSVSGKTREEDIPWYAGISPLGKTCIGTRVKIADDCNKAIPRNATGEVHISNNTFLRRYSQNVKPEDFYVDGSAHWFKTGDTGLMNSDGWIYILGRKKDIIKRAGIPVTPGALESALDTFLHSQTSVIAVPHETLGHEPYAVVRSLNGHSKEQVKKHIVDMFGCDYALGGVATLEDLRLSNFPINQSEKIMKIDLQRAVAQYT